MPEIKKTIKAHIEDKVVVDYITCSLCGKKGSDEYEGTNWDAGSCEINRTTPLIRQIGTAYPEGGYYTSIRYDLCNDCWDSKLKPWLDSQNLEAQEDEVDW